MPLHIPVKYFEPYGLEQKPSVNHSPFESGFINTGIPSKECSDGHHTFGELYEHRYMLWIALCRLVEDHDWRLRALPRVWRSKLHSDGTMYPDSFVLGINKTAGEQITYHLHLRDWEMCKFAETLDRAPEYDGHTPDAAIKRIWAFFVHDIP